MIHVYKAVHTVVETPAFIAAAAGAGMTALSIEALISRLAAEPDAGDLMQGTGGARKLRIAGRGKGKSGGYRVITFYAASDVPVFLLDCYGKGDKANLSRAERNELRMILDAIADSYRSGVAARARQQKS